MKTLLILIALASSAHAEGRHVLVLRAEGNADSGWRTRVDTQVLKLAKNIEGNVEMADITYTDAAVAAGCSVTDATCSSEVIGTLGVDEIVVTTVGAGSTGDLSVSVKRYTKGKPAKTAMATVPAGQQPDAKMNSDIGPIFGVTVAPTPVADTKTTTPKPKTETVTTTPNPKPETTNPTPPPNPSPNPTPTPTPNPNPTPSTAEKAPLRTAQVDTNANNNWTPPPPGGDTTEISTNRLALTGLAVGGGSMLLGLVFWAEANSTQSDINSFPTPKSPKDFQNLTDLESRGDTYALIGNVAFIGGVAIAAVSGYLYWRDRSQHSGAQARVVPAVFDHGGGIALSFGGIR